MVGPSRGDRAVLTGGAYSKDLEQVAPVDIGSIGMNRLNAVSGQKCASEKTVVAQGISELSGPGRWYVLAGWRHEVVGAQPRPSVLGPWSRCDPGARRPLASSAVRRLRSPE